MPAANIQETTAFPALRHFFQFGPENGAMAKAVPAGGDAVEDLTGAERAIWISLNSHVRSVRLRVSIHEETVSNNFRCNAGRGYG
jgi:hypothetical protein